MASKLPLAIVTGAASGVGRSTVRRLVKDGYRVVAIDRDKEGVEKVAKESPDVIMPRVLDLANLPEIEPFTAKLIAELGTPAALVNGAGIALVATALDKD